MKSQYVPKYQTIEHDLVDKISRGIYQKGTHLPTEKELASIYHCSRVTVRQALADLEYKNIIIKIQGSGSIINYNFPNLLDYSRIFSWPASLSLRQLSV